MKRFALAAAVAALTVAPSLAQETSTAVTGAETRVDWIGSFDNRCQPKPVPKVTPTKVAGHGQIKLVEAEVKTNRVPQCPKITLPAILVFYTSSPGFEGDDSFTLSVDDGSGVKTRSYAMKVGKSN